MPFVIRIASSERQGFLSFLLLHPEWTAIGEAPALSGQLPARTFSAFPNRTPKSIRPFGSTRERLTRASERIRLECWHDDTRGRRRRTAVRAVGPTRQAGSARGFPRAQAAGLFLPGGRHSRMHHPVVLGAGPSPGPRRDRDERGGDLARPAGEAAGVRREVRPGVPP